MDTTAFEFLEGLQAHFTKLPDPRVQGRCKHRLLDIIAISLLGVLCGADDWTDLEEFGDARKDWLQEFLELTNGIPSHDTFQRVMELLDRQQFANCLFLWTKALHEASGGKLIAIDGKALRKSGNRKTGLRQLHLVTAWAGENGLTLGQVACEDKSNEITAIPELLKLLSLKGCTVTIDAMGCQKEIAREIRRQKGHYVLALKGNQSGLYDDMRKLFEAGIETGFSKMKYEVYSTSEKGHGRLEERACHVLEIPQDHAQREVWKDLRTLAVTISRREVDGVESWESLYYVSSLPPKARRLGVAIRRHWSIENSQHWVLDVSFGEDSRRQRERNGGANLAAVRRLAVSLLRQEKTVKRGAKAKRMRCALDPNYLLRVLKFAEFDA